jgi:hypothetical protein
MNPPYNSRRLTYALCAIVALAGVVAWYGGVFGPQRIRPPQNSLLVIAPYQYKGTWVFDDPRAGLVREPFVAGIPEMLDVLVADIPDAAKGFRLTFSAKSFPNYQKKLTWLRGDIEGNFYKLDDPPMEGWICPAMFRYYQEAPTELYVRADAIPQQ